MSTTPFLKTEVSDGIGWLIVDRPDMRGALSSAMWEALGPMLRDLAADPSVRVVVIRGSEGHFIAGADITEFDKLRSDAALARKYDEGAEDALSALETLRVPSVAMIEGACVGGGCLIAFGCDLRIAAADCRMGIPAGKLGLAYPYKGLERLAEVVGESETLYLTLTGRLVDGHEARERGYVQAVAEPGGVAEATAKLCGQIAAMAPMSLEYLRKGVRRASRSRMDPDEIRKMAEACFTSADYREGVEAFLEKRAPKFQGR